MHWLAITCLYLCTNLLLYLLLLRYIRAFSRERVIFLYHVGSVGVLVFLLMWSSPRVLGLLDSATLTALSVHGVYSLSFLELWSLSQGSFSLSILAQVNCLREAGRGAQVADLLPLARVGGTKRRQRNESLM